MDVINVHKWCKEFAAERTEIHVERRSGSLSISDEIVANVEKKTHARRTADFCYSRSTIYRTQRKNQTVISKKVRQMNIINHKRQRSDSSREFLCLCADEKYNFLDSIVTGAKTSASTLHVRSNLSRNDSIPFRPSCQNSNIGDVIGQLVPAGTTLKADKYCKILKKLKRAIRPPNRRSPAKQLEHHHLPSL